MLIRKPDNGERLTDPSTPATPGFEDLLVVIVNHQENSHAIALKRGFSRLCKTLLLDSGSDIADTDRDQFDVINPNIFYSGLFNQSVELLNQQEHEFMLFICSDVEVSDYRQFCECILAAFAQPKTGVYAASSAGSNHRQMWQRKTPGLRKVPFVEGFCFAARRSLLNVFAPIDEEVNRLGWGIDVLLGYTALKHGYVSIVDDGVSVAHPMPSGYSSEQARQQRDRWLMTMDSDFRRFQIIAGHVLFKTGFGFFLYRLARCIRR